MNYNKLLSDISIVFSNQAKNIKIIGCDDIDKYSYVIKTIYDKFDKDDNSILSTIGIPFSTNIQLIETIQKSIDDMDIYNLNKEEIILSNNFELNNKIKRSLINISEKAFKNQELNNDILRKNFLTIQIVWVYEYISKLNWNKIPTLIYFGDTNLNELYFLMLMQSIGSNIVYINPKGKDIPISGDTYKFSNINSNSFDYFINIAPSQIFLEPERVIESSAKKAKEDLEDMLYKDNNRVFKPWQFKTSKTIPIHIEAVTEDLYTYWNEVSRFREGFDILKTGVCVPNFFVKINGVYSDIGKYKELFNLLTTSEITLFNKGLNLVNTYEDQKIIYSLAYLLDPYYNLKKDEVYRSECYKLYKTNKDVQVFIVDKLSEFINKHKDKIKVDELLRLILCVINMEDRYIKLIESFDFPFKVPKIVIFTDNRDMFDMRNGLFLHFLNYLGFDIAILSTLGVCSIENICSSEPITNITLDEIKHDFNWETLSNYKSQKNLISKVKNILKR